MVVVHRHPRACVHMAICRDVGVKREKKLGDAPVCPALVGRSVRAVHRTKVRIQRDVFRVFVQRHVVPLAAELEVIRRVGARVQEVYVTRVEVAFESLKPITLSHHRATVPLTVVETKHLKLGRGGGSARGPMCVHTTPARSTQGYDTALIRPLKFEPGGSLGMSMH